MADINSIASRGPSVSLRALSSAALLLLSVCMYFIERESGGDWANWSHGIGMLLSFIYIWIFFRSHQAAVLTSFFQIYFMLGMMFSAAIISGGVYMIEIGRFGTQNGFFWVLVAYLVGGLEASRVGYNLAGRLRFGNGMLRPSDGINKLLIILFVGITLLLSAYVLLRSGGPVLRGVDRVTFWKTMAPAGTAIVPSLVSQSFFFAAFYYLWCRGTLRSMRLPLVIILAYVFVAVFVLGQKFSMFIIFINAWFLIAPAFFPNIRVRLRLIVVSLVLIVILIGFTAFTYVAGGKDVDFVLVRAALQAQLLWSVFEDTTNLSLLPQHAACYFGCGPFENGQDYISFRYLPIGLFYFYTDAGNTLSGFMPALSILTFGFLLSVFLHLLVSFSLGFIQRKLVMVLAHTNLLYGFLLFKFQFGLIFVWYVSSFDPINGLVATAALMLAYYAMFAVLTPKKTDAVPKSGGAVERIST